MEFVTPIVTPIVQSLMVPIRKHLSFVFSSTNHVRNMHARLLELNDTKHAVERKKAANNANDLVIPDHVPRWLAEVETINEEARSIPTGVNGCFNLKLRYKAGKRSVDIIEKIDNLEKQESKIKWTNEQIPLGLVNSSTSNPSTFENSHDGYNGGTQNIFKSRQRIFEDVLSFLEPNSNTRMIALCGMGGVGKTTMMEEIKKVVEKKGMFKWVLRVVVGEKSDPIAIQQAIAQYMGEPLTETTKDARADRLRKRFEGMSENGTNKILVILDDVWEEIDLEEIGLTRSLPNGFKLLITSRDAKLCLQMEIEASSILKMVGLEEAEAHSLFWETVRLLDGDNELQKIGEDILKMCGGLPMALKTIALSLRGEEKDAWIGVRTRLQRHDLEDLYAVVNDIFEISYNKRKDDDKAIFILCGLFPDDFQIALEELVRYGWGLQLFNTRYSIVEARQKTNTCVHNLIRANLLIESQITGYVKMHDLARAFVLSNISKFKQASIVDPSNDLEWPTEEGRESCERILLKCASMSAFPQEFNYPNLKLLKLMNGVAILKFPEDFCKRMEKLQVVAYDKLLLPSPPVSLQRSTNLRTLCLRSCSLVDNDISCLGDLINLEVLSVADCGIRKLPSAIGKLKRLKLLDLTSCIDLCIDDGVFRNLDKLEELYMAVSSYIQIRFTDTNYDELEILLSRNLYALEVEFFETTFKRKNLCFTKLKRFRISVGCLLKENGSYIDEKYPFKNTLKLEANCSDLLECKIHELFYETEELHLRVKDMTNIEDILVPPSTFSNLKVLVVFRCVDLTHLFTTTVANGLTKLESLTVSSCPVMKSLVSWSGNANVIKFPQLVELKLYNLPNFTSIVPGNDTYCMQPLFNKEVVFPKLSKMRFDDLKKLKHIWACDIPVSEEEYVIAMLREIEVNDCDCLVNLFPRNPMRLFSHLEKVKVARCCSIEVLFNIDLGKVDQPMSGSNLRKIEVRDLDELKAVWRINDEDNTGHLIRGFQSVETIMIERCNKFRNVFMPTTANFDFGARTVYILFDYGKQAESYVDTEGISKDDGNKCIVSFPSYHFTHTFHHLRKIIFKGFKKAEVMFEMECPTINTDSVTTQQQPLPLLPRLEYISLEYMEMLSHVWRCNNWNEFFILHEHQQQSSFQNLTSIYLNGCKSIKYLFSPIMSKLLSSLTKITIYQCASLEEVVSNRDDAGEVLTTSTTHLFPCLTYLRLEGLHNLKCIGGGVNKEKTNVIHDELELSQEGVVSWSLCQYSTKIYIENCEALSSVVPSYAALKMQKLQELAIIKCSSMVKVFETTEINHIVNCSGDLDQGSVPLAKPNTITFRHELTSLKILRIKQCHQLEYVFTFSTLESLKKLEELTIFSCKAMKVIVREQNIEEPSSKIALPHLKSIKLRDLPNLTEFFIGKDIDFQLPSLDSVTITKCPQMTVFTSGELIAPKLRYIHTWLGKHDLECGLHFQQNPSPSSRTSSECPAIGQRAPSYLNLIEMDKIINDESKAIIPSSVVPKLQNLEKIFVKSCFKIVKEVFEIASEVTNNELQTVVELPKLREVELENLVSLKYIWKSNELRILDFPKLTRLYIVGCNNLEHVFTSSMVGSFMQLQELHIKSCRFMEVIVKKEEEDECDGKVGEIVFPCLKSLKLERLTSLKGFCLAKEDFTFPLLNTLEINDCPNIMIFTEGCSVSPELKLVDTRWGYYHVGDDINSFIVTRKQEGTIFGTRPRYYQTAAQARFVSYNTWD